jgi:hypothetical protein
VSELVRLEPQEPEPMVGVEARRVPGAPGWIAIWIAGVFPCPRFISLKEAHELRASLDKVLSELEDERRR